MGGRATVVRAETLQDGTHDTGLLQNFARVDKRMMMKRDAMRTIGVSHGY